MKVNKYVKDYRIIEEFDEKGKVHTSTEYIGDNYFFTGVDGKIDSRGRKCLAAVFICAAAYIFSLIFETSAMHTLVTSLLYAFCAVPLFILTESAVRVLKIRIPMERRQAEKISNTFPPAALFLGVMSLGAVFSDAVCIMNGMTAVTGPDILLIVCAVAVSALSFWIFASRESFKTVKAPV